jgi:ligand-binding sensor domain-containing protein/signal transduction histidine kinase
MRNLAYPFNSNYPLIASRKLFLSLSLWLLCLLTVPVAGQTISQERLLGRYQQFNWQDQHGLPQNGISAITQTPDGYLWLACAEGVVRFDGVRFTAFDNSNTGEIKSNNIQALLTDHTGILWVGTHGGGLSSYKDGRFTLYTTQDGLSDSHIKSLFEDRQGNLWIGTDGGGLNRFREGRFTVYDLKDGLPDNHIRAIVEDATGGLWVGTNGGLAQFKDGRFTVYTTRNGLVNSNISSLYQDKEGNLWIGTRGGLSRFRDGRFTNYGAKDGVKNNEIQAIHPDREGNLWFGTLSNGLYRLKNGQFVNCTTAQGLINDNLQAIYQDPEGDLWLGTSGGGLAQLRDRGFSVYTVADGLPHDMIGAIYEDATGGVWVGTTEGLCRFKDNKFTVYTAQDGRPFRDVISICADLNGNLWINSSNPDTGTKLLQLSEGHAIAKTAPPHPFFGKGMSVFTDRAGNLWGGTSYDGLHLWRDGRHTVYHRQDGLADDYISTLYEDRENNLWVGTRNGVSRFRDGHFTSWTEENGFAGKHIISFYEDRDGALWIGTHGDGLFRFKEGKFSVITTKDGLYDNLAFQILEDDDGNLWMSGNKGIYRASLQELNDFAEGRIITVNSFAYGAADGMISRECNGANPAGVKARDGRLWFPTIRGVVVINPRQLNRQPPLVTIQQVLIDGEAPSAGQGLEIKPGQENLEILYTALSWGRPQQIRFKYQLVGMDHGWVDAGTRRVAYYPHLPPGEYTFRVIADNGEGVWNKEGQTLRLIVLPPFYRTWWFTLLVLASGLGLALLAYKLRVHQLERAHALQEAFSRRLIESQEQERKRIAAELHDSLGQNLLVIKNRVALAKLTSNDLPAAFQQLDQISDSTMQAIQEVRQIAYNLRPHHLDSIGLTRSLEEMLRRVEESSGIGLACEIAPLDKALPKEAEINLYRIVQEAVSNIVKHAQATRAGVEIERQKHRLLITIRDNGKGFATEDSSRRRGLGLTGIAERVRILGGLYHIESEPGKGTTLTAELPLPDKESG